MNKKFYNFSTANNRNELYVYGEIIGGSEKWSEDDVTFLDFKDKLNGLDDNSILDMYINSVGGSVFATQSIIALLKRAKDRGIEINAYIDGLGASCASWLACVADNLYIYKQSILMLHKPMTFSFGNSNDMKKEIEVLDKIENDVMLPLYMDKVKDGVSEEEIKNMLSKETWLTASEIEEYFNVISIDEAKEIVAIADKDLLKWYSNTPKELLEVDSAKEEVEVNNAKELAEIKNKIKELEVYVAINK